MRPSATLLFLTPLALLLAGATRAPAEVVPWSYNWKPRTGLILSDRPGTGGIFLTNQPHQQAAGAATVIAAYVGAFSSALANAPDHLTNKGYGLILFLTDDASQAKARLTFSGLFNGMLTATQTQVANTFTGPTSKAVHLGHHWYTVTLSGYVPPTALKMGKIEANVTVRNNPEPSALVLAVLGSISLGLFLWRVGRGRCRKAA
jgi:hypothetical protein